MVATNQNAKQETTATTTPIAVEPNDANDAVDAIAAAAAEQAAAAAVAEALAAPATAAAATPTAQAATEPSQPPPHLLCPITLTLMVDPVFLSADGRTYERTAITEWLRTHTTAPLNNAAATVDMLSPNFGLRSQLNQYHGRTKVAAMEAAAATAAATAAAADAQADAQADADAMQVDVDTVVAATDAAAQLQRDARLDAQRQAWVESNAAAEAEAARDRIDVTCVQDHDDDETAGGAALMVTVTPPSNPRPEPQYVIVVLDKSGSMTSVAKSSGPVEEGAGTISQFQLAIHAGKSIVAGMTARDYVAVVTFGSVAETVLNFTQMTTEGKATAMARLDAVKVGGMTNMWAALQAAFTLMPRGQFCSMIVLTDGDSTVNPPRGSVTDTMSWYLRRHKEVPRHTLHTIGFGHQLNTRLLRELSAPTRGMFSFAFDSTTVGSTITHLGAQCAVTMASSVTLSVTMTTKRHNSINEKSVSTAPPLPRPLGWSSAVPYRAGAGAGDDDDGADSEDDDVDMMEKPTKTKVAKFAKKKRTSLMGRLLSSTSSAVSSSNRKAAPAAAAASVPASAAVAADGTTVQTDSNDDVVQGWTLKLPNLADQPLHLIFPGWSCHDHEDTAMSLSATLSYTRFGERHTVVTPLSLHNSGDVGDGDGHFSDERNRVAVIDMLHGFDVDGKSGSLVTNSLKEFQTAVLTICDKIQSSQSLYETVNDQVKQAVMDQHYLRWGRHFLPSLELALLYELRHNFKDVAVAGFGRRRFQKALDAFEDAFLQIPPPVPRQAARNFDNYGRGATGASANRTRHSASSSSSSIAASQKVCMSRWYSSAGPCFHGAGQVPLADGTSKCVRDLQRSDVLANGNIVSVVTETRRQTEFVLINDALWVTAWHPVCVDGMWQFPMNVHTATLKRLSAADAASDDADAAADVERVKVDDVCYNIVLQRGQSVVEIDGVECVSMGHSLTDDDNRSTTDEFDAPEAVLSHAFFGSHERVIASLQKMDGYASGRVLVSGCKRSVETGLVNGFV